MCAPLVPRPPRFYLHLQRILGRRRRHLSAPGSHCLPAACSPRPSCGAGRISEQPKCSVITHTWQRTSSIVSKRHHVLPCFGEHGHPSPVLEVQSEETSVTLPVLLPTPWPLHLSQGLPTSWPQGTPHARRRRQQAGCYVAACKAGRNQGDSQHGGDR